MIKQDHKNANRGTDRGRAVLRESIEKYGLGRSILVDKNNTIIAGNKTYKATHGNVPIEIVETDGTKLIVVRRNDLDLEKDSKARELAYADNRVSELDLDWDPEQLNNDIKNGLDLSGFFNNGELNNILKSINETLEDEKEIEVKNSRVKLNQTWQLGKHKLLCGDSSNTNNDYIKNSTLSICDPPFNMDPEKQSLFLKSLKTTEIIWLGEPPKIYSIFSMADRKDHRWSIFWYGRTANVAKGRSLKHPIPNTSIILVFGDTSIYNRSEAIRILGVEDKNLYGSIFANRLHWKIRKSSFEKPKHLWAGLIALLSNKGDVIFDPFVGSGITYEICEEIDRACHGIELDPNQCDIAIERWEKFTGKRAELIEETV